MALGFCLADSIVLGYVGVVLLSRSLDNQLFHRITMTFPGLIARTVNICQGPELLEEVGSVVSSSVLSVSTPDAAVVLLPPSEAAWCLGESNLNEGHNQELRWTKALTTPHRLARAGWTTGEAVIT